MHKSFVRPLAERHKKPVNKSNLKIMKRIVLFVVLLIPFLSVQAQIKVISTGKVGINNTSPTYQLDVSGNFRVTDGDAIIFSIGEFYSTGYGRLGSMSYPWVELYAQTAYLWYDPIIISDEGLKVNIRNMQDVKSKFSLLRPVVYKLNREVMKADAKTDRIGDQYGLIAQDVEKLFPELVTENDNGLKGIRYTELIPVMIKMIQTQQQEIDLLKTQVSKLQDTSL